MSQLRGGPIEARKIRHRWGERDRQSSDCIRIIGWCEAHGCPLWNSSKLCQAGNRWRWQPTDASYHNSTPPADVLNNRAISIPNFANVYQSLLVGALFGNLREAKFLLRLPKCPRSLYERHSLIVLISRSFTMISRGHKTSRVGLLSVHCDWFQCTTKPTVMSCIEKNVAPKIVFLYFGT